MPDTAYNRSVIGHWGTYDLSTRESNCGAEGCDGSGATGFHELQIVAELEGDLGVTVAGPATTGTRTKSGGMRRAR